MTILIAILIFCFLILIHEGGHFTAAKLTGVKVNEFAVGMGPLIYQKQKGETLYSLRALPIGGYCAMEGEDETSEDERSFGSKSFFAKAFIVVAGALMNLLFAIIVMSILSLSIGVESTIVGDFSKMGKAQESGMMKGDKIVAIQGVSINQWKDIVQEISQTKEKELEIQVERKGQLENLEIPVIEVDGGQKIIGIQPKLVKDPIKSVVKGVTLTVDIADKMFSGLKQLITGEVSAKELTGVVGITVIVSNSIKSGLFYVGYITAFISLNLAIVNMLPFPALDGGRLMFLIIRKVTGKAISDKLESNIHFVGILLLFSLMIYVTWQDILRLLH